MNNVERSLPSDGPLEIGFTDAVRQSQAIFRRVLDAMARPGTCHRLDDAPSGIGALNAASTAIALTLLDESTQVWLDAAADAVDVRNFLSFHCGCPFAESPSEAAFALVAGAMPPLDRFNSGTDEFPENSTTVIAQVTAVEAGDGIVLTGPGIEAVTGISDPGLADSYWQEWEAMRVLYPCGVDVILTAGESLTCLPRSVRRVARDGSTTNEGESECM